MFILVPPVKSTPKLNPLTHVNIIPTTMTISDIIVGILPSLT